MSVPEQTAASPTEPSADHGSIAAAHVNDNWVKRTNLFGLAKSLGVGALAISFGGWLVHSYATPAATSVWQEMIQPRIDNFIVDSIRRSSRIHDFMVTEINSYLSGNISSLEKPNELGAKLRTLANSSDTIETISNSLFGNVDSVYTIATDYNLEQIKDATTNTISVVPIEPKAGPVRLLIYADPSQHCIWTFVQTQGELQRGSRKERLNFTIKLNNNALRDGDNTQAFAREIGRFITKRQGTGGGGRDDEEDLVSSSFSANIQKIEIIPQFPAFDPIKIVGSPDNFPKEQPVVMSITGYVLITRRRTENRLSDCTQNAVTASSGNGGR